MSNKTDMRSAQPQHIWTVLMSIHDAGATVLVQRGDNGGHSRASCGCRLLQDAGRGERRHGVLVLLIIMLPVILHHVAFSHASLSGRIERRSGGQIPGQESRDDMISSPLLRKARENLRVTHHKANSSEAHRRRDNPPASGSPIVLPHPRLNSAFPPPEITFLGKPWHQGSVKDPGSFLSTRSGSAFRTPGVDPSQRKGIPWQHTQVSIVEKPPSLCPGTMDTYPHSQELFTPERNDGWTRPRISNNQYYPWAVGIPAGAPSALHGSTTEGIQNLPVTPLQQEHEKHDKRVIEIDVGVAASNLAAAEQADFECIRRDHLGLAPEAPLGEAAFSERIWRAHLLNTTGLVDSDVSNKSTSTPSAWNTAGLPGGDRLGNLLLELKRCAELLSAAGAGWLEPSLTLEMQALLIKRMRSVLTLFPGQQVDRLGARDEDILRDWDGGDIGSKSGRQVLSSQMLHSLLTPLRSPKHSGEPTASSPEYVTQTRNTVVSPAGGSMWDTLWPGETMSSPATCSQFAQENFLPTPGYKGDSRRTTRETTGDRSVHPRRTSSRHEDAVTLGTTRSSTDIPSFSAGYLHGGIATPQPRGEYSDTKNELPSSRGPSIQSWTGQQFLWETQSLINLPLLLADIKERKLPRDPCDPRDSSDLRGARHAGTATQDDAALAGPERKDRRPVPSPSYSSPSANIFDAAPPLTGQRPSYSGALCRRSEKEAPSAEDTCLAAQRRTTPGEVPSPPVLRPTDKGTDSVIDEENQRGGRAGPQVYEVQRKAASTEALGGGTQEVTPSASVVAKAQREPLAGRAPLDESPSNRQQEVPTQALSDRHVSTTPDRTTLATRLTNQMATTNPVGRTDQSRGDAPACEKSTVRHMRAVGSREEAGGVRDGISRMEAKQRAARRVGEEGSPPRDGAECILAKRNETSSSSASESSSTSQEEELSRLPQMVVEKVSSSARHPASVDNCLTDESACTEDTTDTDTGGSRDGQRCTPRPCEGRKHRCVQTRKQSTSPKQQARFSTPRKSLSTTTTASLRHNIPLCQPPKKIGTVSREAKNRSAVAGSATTLDKQGVSNAELEPRKPPATQVMQQHSSTIPVRRVLRERVPSWQKVVAGRAAKYSARRERNEVPLFEAVTIAFLALLIVLLLSFFLE